MLLSDGSNQAQEYPAAIPHLMAYDGIPSDLCSIQYLKIEEVAQALVQSRLGTPMVESAYRIIPVAPADRHLSGHALAEPAIY